MQYKNNRGLVSHWSKLMIATACIIFIVGCADIIKSLKRGVIEKPTVQLTKVDLTDFDFETAALLFHIRIENPNPVSIHLDGYQYDLEINSRRFIEGNQKTPITIEQEKNSDIAIPISLKFKELKKIYDQAKQTDSLHYKLATQLFFDLPVLGTVQIPVITSDYLPVPRFPKIRLERIKLKQLSFTGASLDFQFNIENPNAFALKLDNLEYYLTVNDAPWASGKKEEEMKLAKKDASQIVVPFSLNFFEIGRSAYNMLSNKKPVEFGLQGKLQAQSPLFTGQNHTIEFSDEGEIDILR